MKRLVLGERTFPHELPNQKGVACSAHYTFEAMNFQDVWMCFACDEYHSDPEPFWLMLLPFPSA